MPTIQSNIGLVTGMEIGETVDALMGIAARPRNALVERTDTLKDEELAVTELSALLLSVQYLSDNLGKEELFEERDATSSNEAAMTATVNGDALDGTYEFTPVRSVTNQQFLSGGFKSETEPIGAGQLTFRFGDDVQRGTPLELFNGGEGIQRGQIRITDRSGVSAQIDLSTVRTVDDVIEAINGNTTLNVKAVARDDGFRLIDNTGQSVSNLKVQEVSGGTTAASLGLANIDVASAIADGQNIVRLYDDLELDQLNDGNGVNLAWNYLLGDINYSLRDGTEGTIDFSPLGTDADGASFSSPTPSTLGELIDAFNAAEPGKLRLEIAPDGDRLMVTDLTEGDGTFSLASRDDSDSEAVEDLGLGGQAIDGVIVGRRLLGGTASVLLSSLNGGQGLGELGALELTDRGGMSDTVNLAGAETIEDVVRAINAADVGITAEVNGAKNGINLTDTTGKQASNLIVANGDAATATADKLGLAVDAAVTSTGTGDMHLQVISQSTRLDDLNGGTGVARGDITIVDSNGQRRTIKLRKSDSNPMETIDDVIKEISRSGLDVVAEINETGDGIRIRDTGGGSGTLSVVGTSGTTAADLHLLGEVATIDIDGQQVQTIDGSTTEVIEVEEGDTLEDLMEKVNTLSGGVTAATFNDGSGKPIRLSLRSDASGQAGALVLDTSGIDFSLRETVKAQDALLVLGDASSAATSVLISSRSNRFSGVIPGVTLDLKQASDTPVTVRISRSDTSLTANMKVMVDNYKRVSQAAERIERLQRDDRERPGAFWRSGRVADGYRAVDVDLRPLSRRRLDPIAGRHRHRHQKGRHARLRCRPTQGPIRRGSRRRHGVLY